MSKVTIDPATRVLVIDGKKVFPIGFSNPPPLGKQSPSGKEGLQELADAGGSFIRTGTAGWSLKEIDQQIAAEKATQDAAAEHGLHTCGSGTCRTCRPRWRASRRLRTRSF